MADDIVLELARIQREALEAVQARMAAEQRGEAFTADRPDRLPAPTFAIKPMVLVDSSGGRN